jgi:hypothetical protein
VFTINGNRTASATEPDLCLYLSILPYTTAAKGLASSWDMKTAKRLNSSNFTSTQATSQVKHPHLSIAVLFLASALSQQSMRSDNIRRVRTVSQKRSSLQTFFEVLKDVTERLESCRFESESRNQAHHELLTMRTM